MFSVEKEERPLLWDSSPGAHYDCFHIARKSIYRSRMFQHKVFYSKGMDAFGQNAKECSQAVDKMFRLMSDLVSGKFCCYLPILISKCHFLDLLWRLLSSCIPSLHGGQTSSLIQTPNLWTEAILSFLSFSERHYPGVTDAFCSSLQSDVVIGLTNLVENPNQTCTVFKTFCQFTKSNLSQDEVSQQKNLTEDMIDIVLSPVDETKMLHLVKLLSALTTKTFKLHSNQMRHSLFLWKNVCVAFETRIVICVKKLGSEAEHPREGQENSTGKNCIVQTQKIINSLNCLQLSLKCVQSMLPKDKKRKDGSSTDLKADWRFIQNACILIDILDHFQVTCSDRSHTSSPTDLSLGLARISKQLSAGAAADLLEVVVRTKKILSSVFEDYLSTIEEFARKSVTHLLLDWMSNSCVDLRVENCSFRSSLVVVILKSFHDVLEHHPEHFSCLKVSVEHFISTQMASSVGQFGRDIHSRIALARICNLVRYISSKEPISYQISTSLWDQATEAFFQTGTYCIDSLAEYQTLLSCKKYLCSKIEIFVDLEVAIQKFKIISDKLRQLPVSQDDVSYLFGSSYLLCQILKSASNNCLLFSKNEENLLLLNQLMDISIDFVKFLSERKSKVNSESPNTISVIDISILNCLVNSLAVHSFVYNESQRDSHFVDADAFPCVNCHSCRICVLEKQNLSTPSPIFPESPVALSNLAPELQNFKQCLSCLKIQPCLQIPCEKSISLSKIRSSEFLRDSISRVALKCVELIGSEYSQKEEKSLETEFQLAFDRPYASIVHRLSSLCLQLLLYNSSVSFIQDLNRSILRLLTAYLQPLSKKTISSEASTIHLLTAEPQSADVHPSIQSPGSSCVHYFTDTQKRFCLFDCVVNLPECAFLLLGLQNFSHLSKFFTMLDFKSQIQAYEVLSVEELITLTTVEKLYLSFFYRKEFCQSVIIPCFAKLGNWELILAEAKSFQNGETPPVPDSLFYTLGNTCIFEDQDALACYKVQKDPIRLRRLLESSVLLPKEMAFLPVQQMASFLKILSPDTLGQLVSFCIVAIRRNHRSVIDHRKHSQQLLGKFISAGGLSRFLSAEKITANDASKQSSTVLLLEDSERSNIYTPSQVLHWCVHVLEEICYIKKVGLYELVYRLDPICAYSLIFCIGSQTLPQAVPEVDSLESSQTSVIGDSASTVFTSQNKHTELSPLSFVNHFQCYQKKFSLSLDLLIFSWVPKAIPFFAIQKNFSPLFKLDVVPKSLVTRNLSRSVALLLKLGEVSDIMEVAPAIGRLFRLTVGQKGELDYVTHADAVTKTAYSRIVWLATSSKFEWWALSHISEIEKKNNSNWLTDIQLKYVSKKLCMFIYTLKHYSMRQKNGFSKHLPLIDLLDMTKDPVSEMEKLDSKLPAFICSSDRIVFFLQNVQTAFNFDRQQINPKAARICSALFEPVFSEEGVVNLSEEIISKSRSRAFRSVAVLLWLACGGGSNSEQFEEYSYQIFDFLYNASKFAPPALIDSWVIFVWHTSIERLAPIFPAIYDSALRLCRNARDQTPLAEVKIERTDKLLEKLASALTKDSKISAYSLGCKNVDGSWLTEEKDLRRLSGIASASRLHVSLTTKTILLRASLECARSPNFQECLRHIRSSKVTQGEELEDLCIISSMIFETLREGESDQGAAATISEIMTSCMDLFGRLGFWHFRNPQSESKTSDLGDKMNWTEEWWNISDVDFSKMLIFKHLLPMVHFPVGSLTIQEILKYIGLHSSSPMGKSAAQKEATWLEFPSSVRSIISHLRHTEFFSKLNEQSSLDGRDIRSLVLWLLARLSEMRVPRWRLFQALSLSLGYSASLQRVVLPFIVKDFIEFSVAQSATTNLELFARKLHSIVTLSVSEADNMPKIAMSLWHSSCQAVFQLRDDLQNLQTFCKTRVEGQKVTDTKLTTTHVNFMKRLEYVIRSVSDFDICQAAVKCGAFARALFYLERALCWKTGFFDITEFSKDQKDVSMTAVFNLLRDCSRGLFDDDLFLGVLKMPQFSLSKSFPQQEVFVIPDRLALKMELTGRWSEAATEYRKLMRNDPNDIQWSTSWLRCLLNSGCYEECINYTCSDSNQQADHSVTYHLLGIRTSACWSLGSWVRLEELIEGLESQKTANGVDSNDSQESQNENDIQSKSSMQSVMPDVRDKRGSYRDPVATHCDILFGKLLLAIHKGDLRSFKKTSGSMISYLKSPLSAALQESQSRAKPLLEQLIVNSDIKFIVEAFLEDTHKKMQASQENSSHSQIPEIEVQRRCANLVLQRSNSPLISPVSRMRMLSIQKVAFEATNQIIAATRVGLELVNLKSKYSEEYRGSHSFQVPGLVQICQPEYLEQTLYSHLDSIHRARPMGGSKSEVLTKERQEIEELLATCRLEYAKSLISSDIEESAEMAFAAVAPLTQKIENLERNDKTDFPDVIYDAFINKLIWRNEKRLCDPTEAVRDLETATTFPKCAARAFFELAEYLDRDHLMHWTEDDRNLTVLYRNSRNNKNTGITRGMITVTNSLPDLPEGHSISHVARLVTRYYIRSALVDQSYSSSALMRVLQCCFALCTKATEATVQMKVFTDDVCAHFASTLTEEIKETEMPVFLWYTIVAQLVSRCQHELLGGPLVQPILASLLASFPDRMVWHLLPMAHSERSERQKTFKSILNVAKKAGKQEFSNLQNHVETCSELFTNLIDIATDVSAKADRKIMKASVAYPRIWKIFEKQSSSRAATTPRTRSRASNAETRTVEVLMPTMCQLSPLNLESKEAITMAAMDNDIEVLRSKQKPKKLTLIGSDGKTYVWLAKNESKGDLRKDTRMVEVAQGINTWVSKDHRTATRFETPPLRCFSVIPLNEISGFIQWIPNLETLRGIIFKYGERTEGADFQIAVKNAVESLHKANKDTRAVTVLYQKARKRLHPVLHQWVADTFGPDPSRWLAARRRLTTTIAAWSMVGFVIGLGDRHGENITIDKTNGDCIHVDFDCLFGKGLMLAVPEVVPFRLTPNLESSMGITGVHGTFEQSCIDMLRLLRCHQKELTSLLHAFLYDPLIEWSRVGRGVQSGDAGGVKDDYSLASIKARTSLQEILWKLQGKVNFSYRNSRDNLNSVGKIFFLNF
eukprot:GHVP01004770.1.p1 GENE.GHVP01004770.1~~GHVP01004770.1.p1  ORF type:complete len:3102 (-),score=430.64 GHVP01004770.1:391-9696(-)